MLLWIFKCRILPFMFQTCDKICQICHTLIVSLTKILQLSTCLVSKNINILLKHDFRLGDDRHFITWTPGHQAAPRSNSLTYFGHILCTLHVATFSPKAADLPLIFFLKEEDLITGKNSINNEEKYVFFFRIDVFPRLINSINFLFNFV